METDKTDYYNGYESGTLGETLKLGKHSAAFEAGWHAGHDERWAAEQEQRRIRRRYDVTRQGARR